MGNQLPHTTITHLFDELHDLRTEINVMKRDIQSLQERKSTRHSRGRSPDPSRRLPRADIISLRADVPDNKLTMGCINNTDGAETK